MSEVPSGYTRAEAVTKSDSTVFGCKAFYVGGAGNVAIKTHSGATAVTLTACIVGQIYPIQCYNIMSTNTTATAIVALW
jgi:hypothetical protein